MYIITDKKWDDIWAQIQKDFLINSPYYVFNALKMPCTYILAGMVLFNHN